jgi:hypothetical protein
MVFGLYIDYWNFSYTDISLFKIFKDNVMDVPTFLCFLLFLILIAYTAHCIDLIQAKLCATNEHLENISKTLEELVYIEDEEKDEQ